VRQYHNEVGAKRIGVADVRTNEKPHDRSVLVRKRRARSDRRSHYEHRLLLRQLSGRLPTDRSAPEWTSRLRSRWRDRVRTLPERSRRIPKGISITMGLQAQGRIVDEPGRRHPLRFAHVPQFRERHWLSVYRTALRGDLPPLEMRVHTKSKPAGSDLPNDVPSYSGYSLKFMAKLFTAWIAMLLRR
jgi:hypothetical protein